MWLFLGLYVVATTMGPAYLHYERHGVVSWVQILLSFFLGLNFIVCVWEMCLYSQIDLIEQKHVAYLAEYKGRALELALAFFFFEVRFDNLFTSALWAEVSGPPCV